MRSPYAQSSSLAQRALRSVAFPASVLAHIALGLWVFKERIVEKAEPVWVEMAMVEPEPPPPPEPEPEPELEPEPEKPKPKKEPVKFEETVDVPVEDTPPPEQHTRPVRRVHGLSANSVAAGSGSGVNVRVGNTTAAAPTDDLTPPEDPGEFSILPYASVTTKPKRRFVPPIEVPQEAIDNEIEGTWTVLVDVDEEGRVTEAKMKAPVGYGIDEACVEAFKRSRWKPGLQDGQPVQVTGIPMECRIVKAPS